MMASWNQINGFTHKCTLQFAERAQPGARTCITTAGQAGSSACTLCTQVGVSACHI